MKKKPVLGNMLMRLFGVLTLTAIIFMMVYYWYDIIHVPFNLPLFFGIAFIFIPIGISLVVQPNLEKNRKAGGLHKALGWLYIMCLLSGIFCAFASFGWYWNAIMIEMDEPIFTGAISLYIGGSIWLLVIASEHFANTKGASILFVINSERKTHEKALSQAQAWALFLIFIITGSGVGLVIIGEPETCFRGINSFSDPAYDLPTSPHFNTNLDNEIKVDQTILAAFEKALCNMTRLQKMGGFPMGSKLDGTLMWSDRGESCPLFPDEFSLQGGTAKIASVYLEMYKIEPNPVYLQVAIDAADALLAVQDEENGGFFYDGRRYQNGAGYQPHPRNQGRHAIFDDNVMQSCLNFLLDIYNLTGIEKYLNAFKKGINLVFEVEKEGGGWPQRTGFPFYRYEDYVTLNDDSMEDIVFLLLKAYKMFPWERKYLDAAERAGQFLIRVQGNGGSELQKGWAQQYYRDMPAWARAFEPPAICSSDTNQAIKILMELYLYTENQTFLEPIPAAINWLNDSSTIITWIEDSEVKVGWARLYELGTNLPIYGIADGGIDKPSIKY